MIKRDKILWQILALTGLNFINHRFKLHEKCLRLLFIITFPISLIYIALMNLWVLRHNHYKNGIAYLLLPIFCALMWYFAYSRKQVISDVLLQIYRYRKRFNNIKETNSYIMPFTIIIFLSPYVMCIICQVTMNIEMENMHFWTFEFEVQSIIWKRVILLNGSILYCVFLYLFSILFKLLFKYFIL